MIELYPRHSQAQRKCIATGENRSKALTEEGRISEKNVGIHAVVIYCACSAL